MATYDYIVDVENRRLISSFDSTKAAGKQTFTFGDQATISVRLVESNGNDAEVPWRQIDLTGQTIRVGIGNQGAQPNGGTYRLEYGGEYSDEIAYNATAEEVEVAINAIAQMLLAGGCSVVAIGRAFRFIFSTYGDKLDIGVLPDGLYPTTTASTRTVVDGDLTNFEKQDMRFEVNPAAYAELTADIPAPTVTATVLREGDVSTSEVVNFTVDPSALSGSYTITTTVGTSDLIYLTDDIATIASKLSFVSNDVVLVTGTSTNYDTEWPLIDGNIDPLVVDDANLAGSVGKDGDLNLNTTGILELLGGEPTKKATLEIVQFTTTGSKSNTVLQDSCTVNDDVIADDAPTTTPTP